MGVKRNPLTDGRMVLEIVTYTIMPDLSGIMTALINLKTTHIGVIIATETKNTGTHGSNMNPRAKWTKIFTV
jgi:hypothetical protein